MKITKPMLIAIAEDYALTRFSLRAIITSIPGYKICIEARNGKELIDHVSGSTYLPDILLLDICMPVLNGYDTIKILKKKWPQIKIIVLSQNCGQYSVRYMLQNGAKAFLPKENFNHHIERALTGISEHEY